jgi:hypothetical protein
LYSPPSLFLSAAFPPVRAACRVEGASGLVPTQRQRLVQLRASALPFWCSHLHLPGLRRHGRFGDRHRSPHGQPRFITEGAGSCRTAAHLHRRVCRQSRQQRSPTTSRVPGSRAGDQREVGGHSVCLYAPSGTRATSVGQQGGRRGRAHFFVQVHDGSDDFSIWVFDSAQAFVYSSRGSLSGGNIVIPGNQASQQLLQTSAHTGPRFFVNSRGGSFGLSLFNPSSTQSKSREQSKAALAGRTEGFFL